MPDQKKKFQLIFKPYLWISVAFITTYTLLHYLFLLNNPVLPFREDLFRLIAPLVVSWIPLLICLRQPLKRLQYTKGKNNVFGYLFLASITMAVPTTILQEHLPAAVGKLTVLREIEDIGKQPSTKFYAASAYRVDKKAAAVHWSSNTSGRVGSTLNLHMYAVMPLYNKTANTSFIPKDTAGVKIDPLRYSPEDRQRYLLARPPQAWLCIHLKDQMSNRSGGSDKTYRWKRFKEKSLDSLARATFTDITYFEQPANDLNRRVFLRTVRKIYPLDEKHPEALLPVIYFETRDLKLGGNFIFHFPFSRATT